MYMCTHAIIHVYTYTDLLVFLCGDGSLSLSDALPTLTPSLKTPHPPPLAPPLPNLTSLHTQHPPSLAPLSQRAPRLPSALRPVPTVGPQTPRLNAQPLLQTSPHPALQLTRHSPLARVEQTARLTRQSQHLTSKLREEGEEEEEEEREARERGKVQLVPLGRSTGRIDVVATVAVARGSLQWL